MTVAPNSIIMTTMREQKKTGIIGKNFKNRGTADNIMLSSLSIKQQNCIVYYAAKETIAVGWILTFKIEPKQETKKYFVCVFTCLHVLIADAWK